MSSSSAQQQPQSLHKINTHEQVRLVRCASSRSWRSLTQSRSQYLSEGIPSAGSLDRDPITQFEPIGMVSYSPTLMVVNPKVPAKTCSPPSVAAA